MATVTINVYMRNKQKNTRSIQKVNDLICCFNIMFLCWVYSAASATRDSHPQPSRSRLTCLCLLSVLTGLPPTLIIITFPASSSSSSSAYIGSPSLHTFAWIVQRERDLFLSGSSRTNNVQQLLIVVFLIEVFCGRHFLATFYEFLSPQREECVQWEKNDSTGQRPGIEHMQSECTFPGESRGGSRVTDQGSSSLAHHYVCVCVCVCVCVFRLQGGKWCTFAPALDGDFVYLQTPHVLLLICQQSTWWVCSEPRGALYISMKKTNYPSFYSFPLHGSIMCIPTTA